MSICIVGVGDPHFMTRNSYETDILHSSFIKFLSKQRKKNKIIDVVIEGDLLDRFESINVRPFNRAISFIDDIKNNCRHIYLIVGNHDRPDNSNFLTTDHPYNALKKWPKVTVVDKVIISKIKAENEKIQINGDDDDEDEEPEAEFVFVPYVPVGKFREALKTEKLDHPIENPDCNQEQWQRLKNMAGVFAHQEFYGAKIGNKRSIEGDVWPKDAPFLVSGHIHDEEYLQDNLHYTGTPMQHGYTDTGRKTISLYNYQCVNNKWQMVKEEKVDLEVPKKIHIKLTKEELLNFEPVENASLIKIDIEIDHAEFLLLKKDPKIKALLEKQIKIKPIDLRKQIKKGTIGELVSTKITYTKRLNKAIIDAGEEIRDEFESLFGVIDEKKILKIKKKEENDSGNKPKKKLVLKMNN